MATSKKIKNVVVEPEVCGICADKYTNTIRRKITCKFCQAHTCSKCIENYLLTRHEDAHCLHCRVNYNDTTLLEICTKSYLQHTYFKHRQEVLINRERSHLPALQDRALEELNRLRIEEQVQVLQKEIRDTTSQVHTTRNLYDDIYTTYYRSNPRDQEKFVEMSECWDRLEGLKQDIMYKKHLVYRLRAPLEYGAVRSSSSQESKAEETKKFIRRCTRDGCQGFLSTAWKCGICEWYSCSKCFAVKSQDRDADHECQKEALETAELIKKDCKPCPKCGEFIMKSSGCFAEDTHILCWDGTTKLSQDIKIGDELVGDDGKKRTVWNTLTGEDMMYEVIQNNGAPYIVNSEHTLVLKYSGENCEVIHKYEQPDSILHLTIKEFLNLDTITQKNCMGYKASNGQESNITVKEIGHGRFYGWSVDGNRRFVLNDFTCVRNCDQMFCISCQTPFSWNTGQIVTSGPIHNPHYYEWMKRTGGGAVPRNIGDVPCGGYPNGWQLVRFPTGVPSNLADFFQYFHRLCMEMDDLANHQFRSHVDRRPNDDLHVQFLMNKMDEKKWGQQLAILEKKRKRDAEVQEVVGAFRMVAVELINRIQNYNDGKHFTSIHQVPTPYLTEILEKWVIEVNALIEMINKAFENISRTYNYSVPYIKEIINGRTKRVMFIVEKTNLVLEKRKQTAAARAKEKEEAEEAAKAAPVDSDDSYDSDDSDSDGENFFTEERQLQLAISRSLQ